MTDSGYWMMVKHDGDRHLVHGGKRRLEVEKVGRSERGWHKDGGLRFKAERGKELL
jgi:hypothetical protein